MWFYKKNIAYIYHVTWLCYKTNSKKNVGLECGQNVMISGRQLQLKITHLVSWNMHLICMQLAQGLRHFLLLCQSAPNMAPGFYLKAVIIENTWAFSCTDCHRDFMIKNYNYNKEREIWLVESWLIVCFFGMIQMMLNDPRNHSQS